MANGTLTSANEELRTVRNALLAGVASATIAIISYEIGTQKGYEAAQVIGANVSTPYTNQITVMQKDGKFTKLVYSPTVTKETGSVYGFSIDYITPEEAGSKELGKLEQKAQDEISVISNKYKRLIYDARCSK